MNTVKYDAHCSIDSGPSFKLEDIPSEALEEIVAGLELATRPCGERYVDTNISMSKSLEDFEYYDHGQWDRIKFSVHVNVSCTYKHSGEPVELAESQLRVAGAVDALSNNLLAKATGSARVAIRKARDHHPWSLDR